MNKNRILNKVHNFFFYFSRFFVWLAFFFGFGYFLYTFLVHDKPSVIIGWFTSMATLIGIIFVGFQLREQQHEHQADLHIYATWTTPVYASKDKNTKSDDYILDMPGFALHILPVNSGLVPGSFRFFGICKESDWKKFLKPELKKLKKGKLINTGIFSKKLYFKNEDVLSKNSSRDCGTIPVAELTGNELIYPLDNKNFELIGAKEVGKIRNLPFFEPGGEDSNNKNDSDDNPIEMKDLGIKKKLGLKSFEEETLLIIYLDPDYKAYIKKIKITPPDTDPSLQAAEGVTN